MFFADLSVWTAGNVVLRMIAAVVLGAVIGLDRGAKRRGGGARTDAAVCLGAAMVVMTGQYMEMRYQGTTDVARMASQVVSGVGFLGAGSIIVSRRHQVKGLTSAAGIWVCACIGLAVGIGFVDGAIVATVILLTVLHVLPLIEEKVYKYSRYMVLQVEASEGLTSLELMRRLKADGCMVDMFEVDKGTDMTSYTITLTIRLPRRMNQEKYIESLTEISGILSIDGM